MGRWHRLLVAALAAVGFYSSWSVIEQNISAFADRNATARGARHAARRARRLDLGRR